MSLFDIIMNSARYKEAEANPKLLRGRMWYKELRDSKNTPLVYVLRLPHGEPYGPKNVKSMNFSGIEAAKLLDWWNGNDEACGLSSSLSAEEKAFLFTGIGGNSMDFE